MNKTRIAVTLGSALALAGGIACGGSATPTPTPAPSTVHTTAPTRIVTTPTTAAAPSSAPPPIGAEQSNAVRDAQTYLEMDGFSRKGLIRQLSSDAGDGYTVKAATAAVDSLHIDFNEQAARSAKGYLSMQAFSRNGLIRQLESSSEGFTHSQAVYGVKAAGL